MSRTTTSPLLVAAAAALALLATPVARAAGAAAATIPAASPAADAQDRPFVDGLADQVDEALWWGDFDRLQALYDRMKATKATSGDGFTARDMYFRGVPRNLRSDFGEDYLRQVVALGHDWSVRYPQSPLGPLIEARALYELAWLQRGGGYADTVAPAQWQAFHRTLEQAADALAAHAAVLADEPTKDMYLVMIGRGLGWSSQRVAAIATDGLARAPDEVEIWEELVISNLPKWGGSWDRVDALIRAAAATRQDPADADWLYMRLYRVVLGELWGGFLRESRVDWPRMQRGFRVAMARGPATTLVSDYARIACDARDRALARELVGRLGDQPVLTMFGGGSEGRARYESCRRWALGQDQDPVPAAPTPAPGRSESPRGHPVPPAGSGA